MTKITIEFECLKSGLSVKEDFFLSDNDEPNNNIQLFNIVSNKFSNLKKEKHNSYNKVMNKSSICPECKLKTLFSDGTYKEICISCFYEKVY